MSDRLRQVPTLSWVLSSLAFLFLVASLLCHGTTKFGLRGGYWLLLIVAILYRLVRPNEPKEGPPD